MKVAITVAQALLGVIVTLLILIQAKGTGLGRGLSSQSYHSRRGMENLVFRLCIFLSVVFVCLSVIQLFT